MSLRHNTLFIYAYKESNKAGKQCNNSLQTTWRMIYYIYNVRARANCKSTCLYIPKQYQPDWVTTK